MGTDFKEPTQVPAWTDKMHQSMGNFLMSDGSAQQVTGAGSREFLRNSGDMSASPASPGPNTILFPN